MSQEERDKLEWLKERRREVSAQQEAAEKIGVSERWVRTLLKRMKAHRHRVVLHGLRGRSSNRKLSAQTQKRVGDFAGAGLARFRADLRRKCRFRES
ncbi:MAG: hypothetical protein WKF37_22205 [Bryobacteraceae bacterium]